MNRLIGLLVVVVGGLGPYGSPASAASPNELLVRAQAAAANGDSPAAVRLASEAIEADGTLADAFHLRGRERFRMGLVQASVSDFDHYIKLVPSKASRQWERGIACYYAKQFEEGAQQFELYQTYHDNDVENSVWRYLCMVPTEGVEKARETMLPIRNDPRIPMMQVYELYRGNLEPEEVLVACRRNSPDPVTLAGRQFYAHLYLGLFHEVAGETELAQRYILLAADKKLAEHPGINRYMWDVARIHSELSKKLPK